MRSGLPYGTSHGFLIPFWGGGLAHVRLGAIGRVLQCIREGRDGVRRQAGIAHAVFDLIDSLTRCDHVIENVPMLILAESRCQQGQLSRAHAQIFLLQLDAQLAGYPQVVFTLFLQLLGKVLVHDLGDHLTSVWRYTVDPIERCNHVSQ